MGTRNKKWFKYYVQLYFIQIFFSSQIPYLIVHNWFARNYTRCKRLCLDYQLIVYKTNKNLHEGQLPPTMTISIYFLHPRRP